MLSLEPRSEISQEGVQPAMSLDFDMPMMPRDLSDNIREVLEKDAIKGENVYQAVRCPRRVLSDKLKKDIPVKKNGKHLVLDLDETLIHTFESEVELESFVSEFSSKDRLKAFKISGIDSTFWTYIRPGVEDFLEGVFAEFESVGVWSAGTYEYVHAIVKMIFPEHFKPAFIMTRNDCNEMRLNFNEPICRYKPLENIFKIRSGGLLNQRNTIIVDDRKDICAINCHNNVQIPAFYLHRDNVEKAESDSSLLILLKWFKSPQFRNSKDVTMLKGKSPFKEQ